MSSRRITVISRGYAAAIASARVVLPLPERPSSSTTGRSADAAIRSTRPAASAGTAACTARSGKDELPASEPHGRRDRDPGDGHSDRDEHHLTAPERRGPRPGARDVGAEALRLHRGGEPTAPAHRDDEQGEGLATEATDSAGVSDAARATSEGELPPVLDEHADEAQ